MIKTPSIMSLHLGYRLCIAEMNEDINVLRIFDDYIAELESLKDHQEVKDGIKEFEQKFVELRKDIDDLRHEMHLQKMKLASYSREMKAYTPVMYNDDRHEELKQEYDQFRQKFDRVKKEFGEFTGAWL
jgi:DNA repair exonuclease SbcCD ATPase subunit